MSSARVIWRTVVMAGAMLGSPLIVAAGNQPAPSKDTPTDGKGGAPSKDAPEPAKNPTPPTKDAPPAKNKPVDGKPGSGAGSGSATGSGARPRNADSDRPVGRGFVLS